MRTLTFTLILASAVSSCAVYKKCGLTGCPGDSEVTAQVQALFNQHTELGPSINIQTLDHVVYLSGLVDTDLERSIAESVARQASGVTRIVNSIAVRNFKG